MGPFDCAVVPETRIRGLSTRHMYRKRCITTVAASVGVIRVERARQRLTRSTVAVGDQNQNRRDMRNIPLAKQ